MSLEEVTATSGICTSGAMLRSAGIATATADCTPVLCSHRQATAITVFVFSSIFLSSLAIAFARPWTGGSTQLISPVRQLYKVSLYLKD